MLYTDLVIGTVKLAFQECVSVQDKQIDIELYVKYLKDNFYMLESVTNSRSSRFYTCNCEDNFISFIDWLSDTLKTLGELPKDFTPIYTYQFACVCLDLLQHRAHNDFNKMWLRVTMDKHKLAIDSLVCYRTIERLCSYFPVEVFNKYSKRFTDLNTETLSTRDNHDIHVNFLDDLLKVTYELSIQ